MKALSYVIFSCVCVAVCSTAQQSNNPAPVSIATNALPTSITVDGVTYSNVTFGTRSPAWVNVRHSAGIAKIPLAKLPPELQKQFGYDPKEAADWQKVEQEKAVAFQKSEDEARKKRAEEQSQAAWRERNTKNISGVVNDVVEGEGVILSNANSLVVPQYVPLAYCLLACKTEQFVNGSVIECSAYQDGTYTYKTVTGASMKIPRWHLSGGYNPAYSDRGSGCYYVAPIR